jgi:O-antigen/teichoic acid export membrane protein
MRSRHLRRQAATAAGMYSSVVLGLLGTLVASRVLGATEFGVLTVVITVVGFAQTLLDLTVEEALVKYGFRYVEHEDWGRLRRLYGGGLAIKLVGATAALVVIAALAPFADSLFGHHGLTTPLLIAALIPLAQAPETVSASALILRRRYDVRAAFMFTSQGLRLAAIGIACSFGVTATVIALVLAQVVATLLLGSAGFLAFRRFPHVPAEPLGSARREIFGFVARSSVATGVISLRSTIAAPILGAVSSTTAAGYFKIAQAPQQGLGAVTSPARLILLTEQTRAWERGASDAVFAGVRRFSLGAAALMVVCVPPLYFLMPTLIRLVFGSEYLPAADAARIVLLAGAVQFVLAWTKSLPFSIGRPGLRIVTHGVEALVFVPLVVVLGMRWDVTGAAYAVLVSTLVFAALWLFLIVRIRRRTPSPTPVPA